MSGDPREARMDVARAQRTVEVVNRLGLHARAASKLVQCASRFRAQIALELDGQRVDAKSIMGVLLLCGIAGARIQVSAEGPDAQAAVDAIAALFASRFGEPR